MRPGQHPRDASGDPAMPRGGGVLAIIPARAGSQGVRAKNMARVGGLPLITRAVIACQRATSIDDVLVTSDGDDILAEARSAGARTVCRPAHLASDTATSESALLDALRQWTSQGRHVPEIVVFVQCTSPFIDPSDLDAAVDQVRSGQADCVLSATTSHTFLWRDGSRGAVGVNHDAAIRQRRQDRPAEYAETGAFYVMRTEGFERSGHRFFGRIGIVPTPRAHAGEVDDGDDLDRARAVAAVADPLADWPRLADIDALVMDFDGVHTDNSASVDGSGTEAVRVDRSDGLGVAMMCERGARMLILSTEQNEVVRRRADKLGVECLHGVDDKAGALRSWIGTHGLSAERVAYVGNDVNDRGCLEFVGWPIVVADAHDDVRRLARCITQRPGGRGAVRELIDHLLRDDLAARRGGDAG